MRLTEFWRRMTEHFGAAYVDSFARDTVLAELGHRTVREALDAGMPAKEVWRGVCEGMQIPPARR